LTVCRPIPGIFSIGRGNKISLKLSLDMTVNPFGFCKSDAIFANILLKDIPTEQLKFNSSFISFFILLAISSVEPYNK
jgi:hypothetical protein